jgi:formamidopyrimidine-DNA glycosylase
MPELPEVETTARGIAPHMLDRRITRLVVHEPRLRWRVSSRLAGWALDQHIRGVRRRGKYLLLQLERGHLMVHLGMSGNLRILPLRTTRETHDHFDLELDSGWLLRFNDPRRFGSTTRGRCARCASARSPRRFLRRCRSTSATCTA